MVAAILAALGAAVAVIVIVAVVFAVRSRTSTPYAGQKKEVRQLDTVGVGSQFAGKPRGGASSDVRVSSDHAPAKKPSEGLKGRFAAVGVFSAAVFGTLAAKLWSMQILSSSMYAAEAQENLYTTVSTPAPRGFICDADGRALVKNRLSLTVLADPDAADDRDVVQRLSAVLGVPANVVRARMKDATGGAQSQRVVASDVRQRDVAFIAEHADAFPGITVDAKRTVRDYPYGALASHVLGYVGSVSAEQLENVAEGSLPGIGRRRGPKRHRVPLRPPARRRPRPAPGHRGRPGQRGGRGQRDAGGPGLRRVPDHQGPRAVRGRPSARRARGAQGRHHRHGQGRGRRRRGHGRSRRLHRGHGQLSHLRSFFVRRLRSRRHLGGLYRTEEAHTPLLNRATDGLYAAASTFKAFSGLAALKHGFADTTRTWDCTGSWDGFDTGAPQKCWLHSGHGVLDFREGIVNSCDVVFYEIGEGLLLRRRVAGRLAGRHGAAGRHHALPLRGADRHRPAERVGGARADARLEGRGVPQPPRRRKVAGRRPDEPRHRPGRRARDAACRWRWPTAAIATGKRIMRPHLLKEVRNETGDVVLQFEPEVVAEPDVDPAHLADRAGRAAWRGAGQRHPFALCSP